MTKIKTLAILFVIVLVVFLSGCPIEENGLPDDDKDVYKPDALTIEGYFVTTVDPYAESLTSIGFTIKNSGEEPIRNVDVNFFDIPGFETYSIDCVYGERVGETRCRYDELNRHETGLVTLTLRAPNPGVVIEPLELTVSYYISYELTSNIQAKIPFIDETLDEPSNKYSASVQTDSPIKLEFLPPVGGTEITPEGKTIKKYWAVSERPFEIKMKFKDAGTTSKRAVESTIIKEGDVTMNSPTLVIASGFKCDFEQSGDDFKSTKEVEVPDELACNLQGSTDSAEQIVPLYVEFSYTYKFTKTQKFEVKPID